MTKLLDSLGKLVRKRNAERLLGLLYRVFCCCCVVCIGDCEYIVESRESRPRKRNSGSLFYGIKYLDWDSDSDLEAWAYYYYLKFGKKITIFLFCLNYTSSYEL